MYSSGSQWFANPNGIPNGMKSNEIFIDPNEIPMGLGDLSQWNPNEIPMKSQWNPNGIGRYIPIKFQWNLNEIPMKYDLTEIQLFLKILVKVLTIKPKGNVKNFSI